jgi:hypothetical protein
MSKAAERAIEAIRNNEESPFWSVMIPTRGCSPYLEQTLLSVRKLDPSLRLSAHVWNLYGRSVWSWLRGNTVRRHA